MSLPAKHLLVASMPKAAGTFLLDTIDLRSSLKRVKLVPAMGRREMELSMGRAALHGFRNYFTGAHVCGSKATDRILKYNGIKTVVLTRNLFDCVISLRDHIRRESEVFPMAYFDGPMAALDDDDLEKAIVDLVMPWYFKFYLSWKNSTRPILWLDYEDVVFRTEETFQKLHDHTGVTFKEAPPKPKETPNQSRFNVGIPGRGKQLSAPARETLISMSRHYKHHDLAAIGL